MQQFALKLREYSDTTYGRHSGRVGLRRQTQAISFLKTIWEYSDLSGGKGSNPLGVTMFSFLLFLASVIGRPVSRSIFLSS